ncbi:Poly [ADP-ribose] polymerase (PARP) [Durusdinium trenchii]|uniref:Poly [ADP-ribose] polymerase (PARP) n=1 Tax=Durusdinium trenchii TaxID=1381693 RepID=A0ABP0JC55_9DINO
MATGICLGRTSASASQCMQRSVCFRCAGTACLAVFLTLILQGCEVTCTSDLYGVSSCVKAQYCDQMASSVLEGMPIELCIAECGYRNCTAIQRDCSGRCLLMEHCGHTAPTRICNTIYYLDVELLTTTTTTTTVRGRCYKDAPVNENYLCSPTSACRKEYQVGIYMGFMMLQDCLNECDLRPFCRSVEYQGSMRPQCWMWHTDCVESPSITEGSVYHKAIYKTTATMSTTSEVPVLSSTSLQPDFSATCFPGIVDAGTYECTPRSSCRNQEFANYLPNAVSLQECMDQCDADDSCQAFVHECNGNCAMMIDIGCDGDIPIGVNAQFRGACGSVYRKVMSMATTTQVPPGCHESVLQNPDYTCEPLKSCTNYWEALNLGAIPLRDCMAQCMKYDCGVIQHQNGSTCLLLRECSSALSASFAGTSLYFRDRLWPHWMETTTSTTTVFGQCRAGAQTAMLDFACQPSTHCIEQSSPRITYRNTTIDICAEMCRQEPEHCQYMQHDCNGDCLFLTRCTPRRSSCGARVYFRLHVAMPSSQHLFFDTSLAVAYSQTCYGSGCEVHAVCPFGFYPTECQLISSWGGASMYTNDFVDMRWHTGLCTAVGAGPAALTLQAFCTRRLRTFSYFPENDSFNSKATCPEGNAMMSCLCLAPESNRRACNDRIHFQPNFRSNAPAICQLSDLDPAGGARVGAICAAAHDGVRVQNFRPEQAQHTFDEIQYCGWMNLDAAGANMSEVQRYEADCRAFMQEPSDYFVGGCRTSECFDLADCVRKCNLCSECAGVLHMADGDPMGLGIQCIMQQKDRLNFPVETTLTNPARDELLYVNTRGRHCSPQHEIKRLSLFQDAACTLPVYPEKVQVGDQVLQSNWSVSTAAYIPECSPECAGTDIQLFASFANASSTLCAIIHSSLGFAQGWSLDAGSRTVATSAGARVSFGRTPADPASFPKGSTVTFEGSLVIICRSQLGECVLPKKWIPVLAGQFARMLAIPPHSINLISRMPKSQWADSDRRLQEDGRNMLAEISMGFTLRVKLVMDTPNAAELALTVAADLKAMAGQLDLLSEMLNQIVPMDVLVNAFGTFGSFSRYVDPPVFREIPTVTTTTSTTTSTFKISTAADEEDENVVLTTLVVLSISFGMIWICSTIVYMLYRRIRLTKAQERERVSDRGPVAVVVGGKTVVRTYSGEKVAPLNEEALSSVPDYWVGAREAIHLSYTYVSQNYLAFSQLWYVPHEHMQLFQDFVNYTYRAIPTQDRLCPSGTHEKMRGGCPCVRPGGNPGLPTGFQVKRVIRVEDADKFNRYVRRRRAIMQNRDYCEAPDPPLFTKDAVDELSDMSEILTNLCDDINEVYMWHGAHVRSGLQIAREDFKLDLAGSGAGTMYGKALYFSESATKADEYAKDEPGGHYNNVRALLLCRVCLGRFHYTTDREPAAEGKFKSGRSDSTLGDRSRSVGTYREVAIYDPDQVYPEYVVLYERLHRDETPTPPPKDVPFLLELPLYWKNASKNPYAEGFREHWVVKIEIKELIQRLANGSCSGRVPEVQKVRRVEDSGLWCRYINWKRNLSNLLDSQGLTQCAPPHELDTTSGSGQVLTAKILQEFHRDEAISVENMAPGLNELLLWHGTSRQAAETIAEEGFMVTPNLVHGRRFGHGIYLAEVIARSTMESIMWCFAGLYVVTCTTPSRTTMLQHTSRLRKRRRLAFWPIRTSSGQESTSFSMLRKCTQSTFWS